MSTEILHKADRGSSDVLNDILIPVLLVILIAASAVSAAEDEEYSRAELKLKIDSYGRMASRGENLLLGGIGVDVLSAVSLFSGVYQVSNDHDWDLCILKVRKVSGGCFSGY